MRSQIQLLRAASLTLLVALFVLLPAAPADASILGFSQLRVDFTKPTEVAKQVRWDDTDRFVSTKTGFGRVSDKRGSRDVDLHITKPLALGVWWRPPSSASIKARVTWAGKYAEEVAGDLFVRHSPDARNWTAWQSVGRVRSKEKSATVGFAGNLAIRRAARAWYHQQLRAYAKRDVPWTSDEEAAVTWILERHPDLFKRTKPFIGYVQFLYEASIPDDTRIVSFEADVTWAVSGISAFPKDKAVEAIQRKREDDPWSFKADYSHIDEESATKRKLAEKAIYEAALLHMIAKYEVSQDEDAKHTCLVLASRQSRATDAHTPLRTHLPSYENQFRRLEPSLSREFIHRQSERSAVPRDLDIGLRVIFVSPERHRRMREVHGDNIWKAHQREWPGSFGRLYLSPIGLSEDGKRALVHISRSYGNLSGYGRLLRLEFKDGTWTVVQSIGTWTA